MTLSHLFPYTTLFRSRSKPQSWRIWRMFSWVGWRPARRSAGSPPGMTLKITNTATEIGTSRSEEHTSELQSLTNLVCRLLLENKNNTEITNTINNDTI